MNIPKNSTSRYQTHTFFDTLVLCPLPNTSSSRQNFVTNFGTLSFYFIEKTENRHRSHKFNFNSTPFFIFIIMFSLLYHSHHVIRIRCLYCHCLLVTQHRYECHNKWTVYHTIHKTSKSVISFLSLFFCCFDHYHKNIHFWVLSDFSLLRALFLYSILSPVWFTAEIRSNNFSTSR